MNVNWSTVFRGVRTFACTVLAAAVLLGLAACDTVESLERDGKAYLAKGDRLAASIQFRAVLEKDASNVEAQFHLGRIMADSGVLPDAENYLRRAMELGKPAPEVLPVLVPVLIDLEKYKEALELLQPDPKRAQPTDPRALAQYAVMRGDALLSQRDLTGANTQFQLALAALPEKGKLGLARVALARNERARGEELVGDVIAANPRNADARLASADMLRAAGETEKALKELAEVAGAEPGYVKAQLLYAIALISAGKIQEAQPVLENTKKTTPPGPLLYFAQAMIDCREKRYQACGDNLERVFGILPKYMPAVLLSGQMHYSTGNLETAQDAFVRYLERYPGDLHARRLLAATLLAKNQAGGALIVLRAMMDAGVEDPQTLGLAGQAYMQAGDLRQAVVTLTKAVKLAPGDAEIRSALAMTHLTAGLRRRAEADFRAAIDLKPDNTKADYGLIMLLLGENRIEPAREAVAALEKRLPSDPQTHMLRGVVLRSAGDAPGARQAFQRAAQLGKDYFPAVQELARMDVMDGKPDAARARLKEVLDKDATHLRALLELALVELRTGRRAEGLAAARRAADAHPGSVDALLLVAEALADAGELNEAISSAQLALRARPRNIRALRTLGQLQMSKKDYGSAAVTFSTLVSVQPASVEASIMLASAHLAAGESRVALEVARAAMKRNPRSVEARELVADILIQSRKYREAIEFAKEIQRGLPKSALGYWLEGRALLTQGDARAALKPFQTAANLQASARTLTSLHRAAAAASPGSEREAPLEEWVRNNPEDKATRIYLADALTAKGRVKEAIAHYEELVRLEPMNPRALNNLAWALGAANDPRALEYAERAFQLSPNTAPVLDTYGWLLVNRGKLHEGLQMLLKAVVADDKNPEIRFHLAKALVQAGDKGRARTELKTILKDGTPFPQAEEARALLASLGN
jgi:putative PEP-CTERM system TPR-repeat lipoprotein